VQQNAQLGALHEVDEDAGSSSASAAEAPAVAAPTPAAPLSAAAQATVQFVAHVTQQAQQDEPPQSAAPPENTSSNVLAHLSAAERVQLTSGVLGLRPRAAGDVSSPRGVDAERAWPPPIATGPRPGGSKLPFAVDEAQEAAMLRTLQERGRAAAAPLDSSGFSSRLHQPWEADSWTPTQVNLSALSHAVAVDTASSTHRSALVDSLPVAASPGAEQGMSGRSAFARQPVHLPGVRPNGTASRVRQVLQHAAPRGSGMLLLAGDLPTPDLASSPRGVVAPVPGSVARTPERVSPDKSAGPLMSAAAATLDPSDLVNVRLGSAILDSSHAQWLTMPEPMERAFEASALHVRAERESAHSSGGAHPPFRADAMAQALLLRQTVAADKVQDENEELARRSCLARVAAWLEASGELQRIDAGTDLDASSVPGSRAAAPTPLRQPSGAGATRLRVPSGVLLEVAKLAHQPSVEPQTHTASDVVSYFLTCVIDSSQVAVSVRHVWELAIGSPGSCWAASTPPHRAGPAAQRLPALALLLSAAPPAADPRAAARAPARAGKVAAERHGRDARGAVGGDVPSVLRPCARALRQALGGARLPGRRPRNGPARRGRARPAAPLAAAAAQPAQRGAAPGAQS